MTRFVTISAIFIAITIAQFGVLASFTFPLSSAVLPLALYIILLYTNTKTSFAWVVVFGLLWDLVSYYRFGVYTCSFLLGATALHWAFTRVVTNTSLLSFVVFVALGTLMYSGIVLICVQVLGPGSVRPPVAYHAWILARSAASTGFIALIGYGIIRMALRSVMPTHV